MQSLAKYLLVGAAALGTIALAGIARADDDEDEDRAAWYVGAERGVSYGGAAVAPGEIPPPMGEPLLSPPNHYLDATGATLYPCPRPVPEFVGGTYVTYPPLLPHEFTYQHMHTYYHPDGRVVRAYYKQDCCSCVRSWVSRHLQCLATSCDLCW